MKRDFRFGVRAKLCLSYTVIVVLPTLLAGALLYMFTLGSIESEAASVLDVRANASRNELLAGCARLEEASERFIAINEIYTFFKGMYLDESDLIIAYNQRIKSALQWFDISFTGVRRLGFFSDAAPLIENQYFHVAPEAGESGWYDAAVATLGAGGAFFWEGVHAARDYRFSAGDGVPVLSLWRRPYVDADVLMELEVAVSELLSAGEDELYIDMRTLAPLYPDAAASHGLDRATYARALEGAVRWETDGGSALMRIAQIDQLGLAVLVWTPASALAENTAAARNMFFGIVTLLAVLLFTLTWFLSERMVRRIRQVTRAIEAIYAGRYDVRLAIDSYDELGNLAWHTNELGTRIDNLINKVLLGEMAAKDAQLQALQAQINPHFIYNTLETFQMLAELGENAALCESIASMGELMRYNLSGEKDTTLGDELKNVSQYAALQNVSHGGRIRVEIDAGAAPMDLAIPRLMLQPLVENAVMHGLKGRATLTVEIQIDASGGRLRVNVRNDGTPIDRARLEKVRAALAACSATEEKPGKDCLALTNIARRLRLRYGTQASFELSSGGSTSTVVHIELPLEEAQQA